jgi:hypothetical protein
MKHFFITDGLNNQITKNLAKECEFCYNQCKSIGSLVLCNLYSENRRQGIVENSKCKVFLCDTTKTTKLFREKLDALLYTIPDITIVKKDIEKNVRDLEQKKVNRLVHNLSSINAYNIQFIYDIIPQFVLSQNWSTQIDNIKKEMNEKPGKVAETLLRLSKNNIHMKSEFSIYRKLDREERAQLDFKSHPIRSVILNVLHTFFVDFSNNGIYFNVSSYYGKVKIDYETIQVAIYHLLDNATKYTKNHSTIDITFKENRNNIIVDFKMISIFVEPKEREIIFNEGISGTIAKELKKNGDGIGMWRIKQMLELNNGGFTAKFGDKTETHNGCGFAENIFSLSFQMS